MSDDAKKKFIAAYERRMDEEILHPRQNERLPLRRVIQAQAREIVRCVQAFRPDYAPMAFR